VPGGDNFLLDHLVGGREPISGTVKPSILAVEALMTNSSLLIRDVDDLHATVLAAKRMFGILELGLAVADGHQLARLDVVIVYEEAFDCLGTLLRQVLVEWKTAVCTENLILFDYVTESPNVNGNDRAALLLPDPARLALQVEKPT
jgi:hypothetical protein